MWQAVRSSAPFLAALVLTGCFGALPDETESESAPMRAGGQCSALCCKADSGHSIDPEYCSVPLSQDACVAALRGEKPAEEGGLPVSTTPCEGSDGTIGVLCDHRWDDPSQNDPPCRKPPQPEDG